MNQYSDKYFSWQSADSKMDAARPVKYVFFYNVWPITYSKEYKDAYDVSAW